MCLQNLVRFCQLVLKILSGNKILMSIKGRNSDKILQKMTGNNPKLNLVNNDVHTKFGQILSIRSEDIERNKILMSIKGRNSDKILQKITGNNPKLDLVDDDVHTNLVRFYQFVLKILSGNEILTSIKGRNSIKILHKMTCDNPKLDLINAEVHDTKFGQILSIGSRDIERKRNFDINQGPQLGQNFAKNDGQQSQARSCQC